MKKIYIIFALVIVIMLEGLAGFVIYYSKSSKVTSSDASAVSGEASEDALLSSADAHASSTDAGKAEEAEASSASLDAVQGTDYNYHIKTVSHDDCGYYHGGDKPADGSDILVATAQYDLLSFADDVNPDTGVAMETDDNTAVTQTLDIINKDVEDSSGSFVKQYADDAKADYDNAVRCQGDGENLDFGYYNDDSEFTVYRADSRCLSVVRKHFDFRGGPHGYTDHTAYNYDPSDGRRIALSDLIPDTSSVSQVLAEKLVEKYDEAAFDYPLEKNDSHPESLAERIDELMAGDSEYTGNNDLGYVTWYIDHDRVWFYFDQYDLGAYAAGAFSVAVKPEDFPGNFNTYYLECCNNYVRRIEDEQDSIDGTVLRVKTDQKSDIENITRVSVSFGDASRTIKMDDEPAALDIYAVLYNGRKYLYMDGHLEDDYESLYTVDLNDPGLKCTRQDVGFYSRPPVDPDYMFVSKYSTLMSSQNISRVCHTGDDGLPVSYFSYYITNTLDFPINLKLKKTASLNVLDGLTSDSLRQEEVPAGTAMQLYRTDGEHIVDCVDSSGKYYRFDVDASKFPEILDGRYNLEKYFDGYFFSR